MILRALFVILPCVLAGTAKMVSQTIDTLGTHIGEFEFDAISSENGCGPNSNCFGWSVTGKYFVKTFTNETSFFSMEAAITAMRPWAAGSRYTVNFNFPFKANESLEVASGTEAGTSVNSLFFLRRFSKWSAKSLLHRRNLDQIDMSPQQALIDATRGLAFTKPRFWTTGKNKLHMTVDRWFSVPGDVWNLNTVRKWNVGFSDKWFGIKVKSEMMSLPLESGYIIPEKPAIEEAVEEPTIVEDPEIEKLKEIIKVELPVSEPVPEPTEEDVQEEITMGDTSKFEIDDEGTHIGIYNFTAISKKVICTNESTCFGWDISGQYRVKTYTNHKSEIELRVKVQSAVPWKEGGIFGIAFNFPFVAGDTSAEEIITPTQPNGETE